MMLKRMNSGGLLAGVGFLVLSLTVGTTWGAPYGWLVLGFGCILLDVLFT